MGKAESLRGIFDEDLGVFVGGIASFRNHDMDSGPDRMMEAFSQAGLERKTAEAIWHFFESIAAKPAIQAPAHSHPSFQAMLCDAVQAHLPRMHIRILRVALGWADPKEESMRRIARDYKYSPEQISNLVEDIQTKYNLPSNAFNKSAAAIKRYSRTNGR